MKHLLFTLIAIALAGAAIAQPRMNSNQTNRPCQVQQSTTQMQPGQRMGNRQGGMRMGNKMSVEERAAFRAQVGAASTQEELTKIREQHRAKMLANRAKVW